MESVSPISDACQVLEMAAGCEYQVNAEAPRIAESRRGQV
jgi:hypothetical protein